MYYGVPIITIVSGAKDLEHSSQGIHYTCLNLKCRVITLLHLLEEHKHVQTVTILAKGKVVFITSF